MSRDMITLPQRASPPPPVLLASERGFGEVRSYVRGSHDVSVGCAGAEWGGAGGRASRSVSQPLRCHQTQNGDSPAPPGWLYQQPLKPGSRQLEPVSTRGACSQQTRGPPLPLKTGSLCLSLPGERSTLSPATGPPRLSLKAASVGVGCPE